MSRQREGDGSPAPDKPWCVFVAGSRDLTWEPHYVLVKERLRHFMGQHSVLIHGAGPGRKEGVPGCDAIADRIGNELGFSVYAFPALWKLQGGAAGPIRNRLCIDVWLAFQRAGYRLVMLGFSTGGVGTEGAMEIARHMSRDLTVVNIERITVIL